MGDPSHRSHQAYTLRLSRGAETDEWRIALYCAQTGQRHHFLGMEQLFAFLLQVTGEHEDDLDVSDLQRE